MTASADGQREETLRIAGQQPSWAPDSDRFVYRGCDITGNRCGLWLARALPVEAWDLGVNMTGPILEEPEAAHPDWSPVGDQVVYQSPVGGSWDLYIINIDGTGKRQLTSEPGIEGLPVWSPDGQWVAYLSDNGGNWGIWLIRADGTDQAQLFSFDGGIFSPLPVPPYGSRSWLDEQLSWSP
jgi:TolB protein